MAAIKTSKTKYIFVTGGVVSSIGKGTTCASIGALLQSRGYAVHIRKFDPYLNTSAAMSPLTHGEIYVTADGHETDLDLGYYERFLGIKLSRDDSVSGGRIYYEVLDAERTGKYHNQNVQMIPHVSDKIKEYMGKRVKNGNADFVICEIGGTVGDIEGQIFLEAARQMAYDLGRKNTMFVHLTLAPYIAAADELKTKPTQQSVRILLEKGVMADMLIVRTPRMLTPDERKKIGLFCNVAPEFVISGTDMDNIYKIPLAYDAQNVADRISEHFNLPKKKGDLAKFQKIAAYLAAKNPAAEIAVVGNYFGNQDAYKSLSEALFHAGYVNKARVNIRKVPAETLGKISAAELKKTFAQAAGILVTDGADEGEAAGKTAAARFARENAIPYLGIGAGAFAAADDFLKNVCGAREASGAIGSMRRGEFPCKIKTGTLAHKIYKEQTVSERHRHSYELNMKHKAALEKFGMIISGVSPDGKFPEILEIPKHPFFIAATFNPELQSSPFTSHPLFAAFIRAAMKK